MTIVFLFTTYFHLSNREHCVSDLIPSDIRHSSGLASRHKECLQSTLLSGYSSLSLNGLENIVCRARTEKIVYREAGKHQIRRSQTLLKFCNVVHDGFKLIVMRYKMCMKRLKNRCKRRCDLNKRTYTFFHKKNYCDILGFEISV